MVRTSYFATFDNERVVLSLDWDDATGDILVARCDNTSAFGAHVVVQGLGTAAGARSFEQTFAPGSGETAYSIPVGQQPRFTVNVSDDGDIGVIGWAWRAELVI